MELESITISTAENGFVINAHMTGTDDDGDTTWDNEQFVFLERSEAVKKLAELMKQM